MNGDREADVRTRARMLGAVLGRAEELLKGAAAPVNMIFYALDWNEVKGAATTVQGNVRFEQLAVDDHWQGSAAESYKFAIKPQSDAAGRIGSLAGGAALAVGACAAAGLLFYVALGAIIVKFVAAMATAIVAFGSAVFSWPVCCSSSRRLRSTPRSSPDW